MSIKPIKFSEHFEIDKEALKKLGVFDPILNHDTRLFTDPLLLKDSKSTLMKDAFKGFQKYFSNLLLLLKSSEQIGDKPWRAAAKMVKFPEYKYTCIGYGTGTINGAGSGSVLNEKILSSAKEITLFARNDPDVFLLLPLLEEGVGSDIISDMTQNIIDDFICEFTCEVMQLLGIKGTHEHFSKSNKLFLLPYNPYHKCVIKLLPLDILSNLPLAETLNTWLVNLSERNQALRTKINNLIGITWLETTKKEQKETILSLIKKDKGFFLSVLEQLQSEIFEHYDLEKDFDGLYRWLEDGKKFIQPSTIRFDSLQDDPSLHETVEALIQNFKKQIEMHELWRLFWTELYKRHKHVKEFYSQMLFYMVSNTWIAAQGYKVTIDRVFNKDTKQLEILFTVPGQQRISVLLKHSDNYSGLKKCYESQVEMCTMTGIKSYYVILDFLDIKAKQHKHVLDNEAQSCKVVDIDASLRLYNVTGISNSLIKPDFQSMTTEYEDIDDDHYLLEKRKGGASSYKEYKPLRKKVEAICMFELQNGSFNSARSLCSRVAAQIENEYPKLLSSFLPYINAKNTGSDWRFPTFYGWCNGNYKRYLKSKSSNILQFSNH